MVGGDQAGASEQDAGERQVVKSMEMMLVSRQIGRARGHPDIPSHHVVLG